MEEADKVRPEDLTVKMAYLTLFKKQNCSPDRLVQIYIDILKALQSKNDIVNLEKQYIALDDILKDKLIIEKFSDEIFKLIQSLTPLINSAAVLKSFGNHLQLMLEKNFISEKLFLSVISLKPGEFAINPEFMEEVELTDLKEKEMVMGRIIRSSKVSSVYSPIKAKSGRLGL